MANDLISRGKLRVALNRENGIVIDGQRYIRADCVMAKLDMSPSVDAVKVVHGSWIKKPFLLGTTNVCSRCGDYFGMPHGKFNFCPNCGAKMDGGAGSE